MHETALIESVLTTVESSARAHNLQSIHRIKLVVGKKSGALSDALRFAFDCLASDSFCRGAQLEIEERNVKLKCLFCQTEFAAEETWQACPQCGKVGAEIIEGQELYIDSFEGD